MTDPRYTLTLCGPGGRRDEIQEWTIDPADVVAGRNVMIPSLTEIAQIIREDVAEMAAREEATP